MFQIRYSFFSYAIKYKLSLMCSFKSGKNATLSFITRVTFAQKIL